MIDKHERIELGEGETASTCEGNLHILLADIGADSVFLVTRVTTDTSAKEVPLEVGSCFMLDIGTSGKGYIRLESIKESNIREGIPASAELSVTVR